MPHITLPDGAPGILGPLLAYPHTERHLNGLAEALLRGPSPLTPAEREQIATFVSALNGCEFCTRAHAATARHLLDPKAAAAWEDGDDAPPISDRLVALLEIAQKVQEGGRRVTAADVFAARQAGADDNAIHDTVLIAAAFSMFNRYVDGLDTRTPTEPEVYEQIGAALARDGYLSSVR